MRHRILACGSALALALAAAPAAQATSSSSRSKSSAPPSCVSSTTSNRFYAQYGFKCSRGKLTRCSGGGSYEHKTDSWKTYFDRWRHSHDHGDNGGGGSTPPPSGGGTPVLDPAFANNVVFQLTGEAWLGQDDGTILNRVSDSIDAGPYYANPHLSPDAKTVAYDVEDHSIVIANRDGTGAHQVYSPDGQPTAPGGSFTGDAWDPSFSSDGKSLIFNVNLPGDTASLMTVNVDGTNPQVVARYDDATGYAPSDASYSPDGTQIAVDTGTQGADIPHIALMNADGTGFHLLVNDPSLTAFSPQWTPDGKTIVFWAFHGAHGPYSLPYADLYSVDVATGTLTQLTSTDLDEQLPTVSPDGKTILFDRQDDNGDWAIWGMNVDGTNVHQVLPTGSQQAQYPQHTTATNPPTGGDDDGDDDGHHGYDHGWHDHDGGWPGGGGGSSGGSGSSGGGSSGGGSSGGGCGGGHFGWH